MVVNGKQTLEMNETSGRPEVKDCVSPRPSQPHNHCWTSKTKGGLVAAESKRPHQ